MPPTVSAVVPFYNVEDYVRDALDSIRSQTMTDFEVIVVDDGSTDATAERAREIVDLDPRFRLIAQENRGLGVARNVGAAEATGRYLMFIDSDDLVAPRAFEQLVHSLEDSGSDFAAGHVWRLSLARGLETSWAHRIPFAERLRRTSIREIPLLMRDRMAWNKLWRRSFWDAGGYEFPPIRFEDFPVTLRAHLEATAVDTLPDPIYVWRERPSGDSISQRSHEAASVEDRVGAALMALDAVDALGTDEVRELVHSHLVDVDVREVLAALDQGGAEDMPVVEERATALAAAIDSGLTGLADPVLQAAHRAIVSGDFDRARDIARYRRGERTPQALAAAGQPRPRKADRVMSRGRALARRAAPPPRSRRATLEDVTVLPGRFHYRLAVRFKPALAGAVRGGVTIGRLRPAARVSALPNGVQVDVSVDTAQLAVLGRSPRMEVHLELGPARWAGAVSVTPDQLHGARRAGLWVQAVASNGELAYEGRSRVNVITRVDVIGSDVRLTTQAFDGTLVVERSWPAAPLRIPVRDHVAVVAASTLVADDPADDPVSRRAVRRILHERAGDPPGTQRQDRLILDGPGITALVDGHGGPRRVSVRRDATGWAVVAQEPAHGPTAP